MTHPQTDGARAQASPDLAEAMRASLAATRAGDLGEATRLIQAALGGAPATPAAAPAAGPASAP
jgi:hypothetical protein